MTKKFRKIIMWCVSAVSFLKHFSVNDMSGIARNSSGTVLDLSRFNLDENNLEGDERHDKLGEEDEI